MPEGCVVNPTVNIRSGSDAFTPTTLEWKLQNATRDLLVKDWTSITAAAAITFEVSALLNKIGESKTSERFELLVAADRGLDTQAIGSVFYLLTQIGSYDGDFNEYLLDESGEVILDEGGELILG